MQMLKAIGLEWIQAHGLEDLTFDLLRRKTYNEPFFVSETNAPKLRQPKPVSSPFPKGPPPCLGSHHTAPQSSVQFSSVQSLSCVQLFVTQWTAASQASPSITNSWSLLKFMSIKSVMPSTTSSSIVPFSSCLQSFPTLRSFPKSHFFASGGQSIGASASASVLPMNIQD